MKKFSLLFAFLLTLFSGTSAWAETKTEGFVSGTELPEGWELLGATTLGTETSPTPYTLTDSYNKSGSTGNYCIGTSSTSTSGVYLITPKVTGNVTIPYRKWASGSGTSNIYIYEYTDAGVVNTSAGSLKAAYSTSTSYQVLTISLGSKETRLAIIMKKAVIDDFSADYVVDAGTIAKPTAFTVTGTTYNSASFSWTAGGTESAWQIVYGAAGFNKDSEGTTVDVTTNPYTLTDLTENTSYEAYLRAKNGDDVSSWTSKVSFTTPAQYPVPAGFACTGYTATTATFGWTAGSTETAWEIKYSTSENFDPATEGISQAVTENPYTLSGLTAETAYYAYIRANYGTGYSAWSEKIAFTPSNTMNTTVNDGTTTSSYIPVYGNWVDDVNYNKSQFVISSTALTAVSGREIQKLTFYTSATSAIPWTNNVFDVYMKETDATTVSTTLDRTGDKVFTGSLSVKSDGTMEVTLTDGFVYGGQNLMIGFDMTTKGTYSSTNFYGVNGTSGCSMYVSAGSGVSSSFLPKITITSVPYEAPSVAKPKALEASEIKETSVKLSWTDGEEGLTAWEIKYSTTENFDPATEGTAVEVNANPYTLTGLTTETTYYAYVRAKKGTDYSDWSNMVTFVPTKFASITVNDGTSTSGYEKVPFYGYYANKAETAGQYIIPKANLSAADKGDISKLTLYSLSDNTNWGSAEFKVYLGEVDNTTFASSGTTLVDWENMQEVYEGPLSVVNGLMDITFDKTYEYNGNNLIIGFLLTKTGTSRTVNWYGSQVNYAAAYSYYNYSNVYTTYSNNFSPKTTITYLPLTGAKMKVSTEAIDFGKITPASSNEDKQKTFTISNTGIADLTNISVTYSDEYATDAFSLNDNIATSIAAGGEAITVTVTMDAATAGNYTGTITINADDQTEKTITVTGEYGADPATMAVTLDDNDVDGQTVAYGNVNKVTTKTFCVTNDGDLPLNATITVTGSDAENFNAPASINVAGGTTETFDLTFTSSDFDIEKTATVTLTADELSKSFTVTATMIEMWSEDFSGNTLPSDWESDDSSYWTFSNGVAQGVYSSSYNMTKALTTPALVVTGTSDVLTFKYKRNNAKMAIKKIKDNGDPEALYTDGSFVTDSDWQTYTITNLEAGTYKFQFMNEDYQLDDFEGFKLYVPAAHEAEIKSTTIAATGNQFVEYTASVDVKVTGTNNEELTAKFYIGETQYGSDVVKTVNAGDTETFTVTFTPQTAISGDAYFTIESADIAAFESSKTAVNITAATVLDETVGLPDGLETGTKPSLVLNYTAKDGWNTIAVPFALTDEVLEAIFGEDYKIFELKSFEDKVITFQHATKYNGAYAAGYPFLVYVATAATHANGVVLFDVNVSTTTANYDTKSGVTFQSTYAPMAAGSLTGNFGATTDGEIRKAGEEASLKGFRAYFTGIPEGVQSRINFLDDDIPTGISAIEAAGQLDNIYNLNGQKVQSLKKGMYIINGKKVVIK